MSGKRFISLWLGFIISLVAIFAVVREIDWHRFWQTLREVNLVWICLTLACLLLNLVSRALRWKALMASFMPLQVSFQQSFNFSMIGNMANMLLPFKAGELLRPYLLSRARGASASGLMATIIIERLADIILLAVLSLFVFYVGYFELPMELWKGVGMISGGVLVAIALLYQLIRYPAIIDLGFRFLKWLPAEVVARLKRVANNFFAGFRPQGGWVGYRDLTLWTACVWITAYFMLSSGLQAFYIELPWYAPAFILVITNFGMMLPSSPGAIGLAHYLYVFSLSRFLVDRSEALSFAVFLHAIGFLPVVIIGLYCTWKEGLAWKDLKGAKVTK